MTRSKIIDVGEPSGVYDTSSVRNRVRQWQAQGGGVIEAEVVCTEDIRAGGSQSDNRKRKPERSPRTPSRKQANKDAHYGTPSKSVDNVSEVNKGQSNEQRLGSAPAKRVVSDSHWRKKKSPPQSAGSAKTPKLNTSSWERSGDGIRIKSVTEPISERRKRNEDKSKTPERQSVGGGAGSRVYTIPPGSRRHSERQRRLTSVSSRSLSNIRSDVNSTASGRSDSPDQCAKDSASDDLLRISSSIAEVKARSQRRNSMRHEEIDDSPPPVRSLHDRGSIRSQKGNILSQVFEDSKKLFAKQTSEPTVTPRVPSIEAWLNDTSDPFIDEPERPIKEIAPLRASYRKSRGVAKKTVTQDPNQIWESLDTKEGTRRAMSGSTDRRRIPSSAIFNENPFPSDFDSGSGCSGSGTDTKTASKFVDLTAGSGDICAPTLKRRAARKSLLPPLREGCKSHTSLTDDKDTLARPHHLNGVSIKKHDPHPPLKPSGPNARRSVLSKDQKPLSSIESVETITCTANSATTPSIPKTSGQTYHVAPIAEGEYSEARDQHNPDSLLRINSRLTKHSDLISVLSLPRAESKSIRSARSIRTNRSRPGTATVEDLMKELSTDEGKYMRELQTLVDGVIPVLLTCVLSKSDSAVAAGLFQPSSSAHEDANFTKPIMDMGIALERLKTLHKRIPTIDQRALLTWAHGAQRVYAEYMKAWRMGFQDVVVNLAPAIDKPLSDTNNPSLDEGLPRNQNGDVIDGDGERVDVAFLLKRPLVRLKYLAKTLKGVNLIEPSSEAENLAAKYQGLVEMARLRANEERARLEDEAAANIDPTRARDPRTLAPLSGVIVDRTRRVRARDHFNLAFQHSSGQCVDCRVELLLRDEATHLNSGGDLLICEVDGSGRWLLFPPINMSLVSARNGNDEGEVVVMVRGFSSNGDVWNETFSLRSDDEQAGFEWVQMLGLKPVPPLIGRSHSFVSRDRKRGSVSNMSASDNLTADTPTSPGKSRTPSPRELNIPIGERANGTSKQWAESPSSPHTSLSTAIPRVRKPNDIASSASPKVSKNYVDQVNDLRSLPIQTREREANPNGPISQPPRSFKEALGLSGTSTMSSGLRRTKAKRLSKHVDSCPSTPRSKSSRVQGHPNSSSRESSEIETKMSGALMDIGNLLWSSSKLEPQLSSDISTQGVGLKPSEPRPIIHRQSSVPSTELPYIPKARTSSQPVTPTFEPVEEPVWSTLPESTHADIPNKLMRKPPTPSKAKINSSTPPAALPAQKSSSPVQLDPPKMPVLEQHRTKVRRSSSPLKHEYEPSTTSNSSFDSDASTVEHNSVESITDSSSDEDVEAGDVPTPLISIDALKRISKPGSKPSFLPTPDGTLKPSDSASQVPYKTVPSQPKKAAKTIASIFSWSDTGTWQSLHPDECSIVITPGLIEAFEMSAAHSNREPPSASEPIVDVEKFADKASTLTTQDDEVPSERPLVALELTPLVPLRRGTAIDISVRSPPTVNSQITSGNNVMFRSRNPEECEALYALINHSRIHNPTYIALQNARGPFAESPLPGAVGRRPSSRATNSRSTWFSSLGRSSSYRAGSARAPSIAPSESSVGSMSSAFSALKRFGRGSGGGMFNIALSTITSRNETQSGANSIYSSSDNSSGSGTCSPIPPGMVANKDGSLGLKGAKIRLYIRETASRWRDMGSARLTIMRAERNVVGPDGRPVSTGGHHQAIHEKRIVINGKTKGEILLDVQLGESCFERVARTGIAVSVWEDVVGPNGEVGVVGAVGGVAGGRAKVYMLQMKSEAETAYTFSMVGKLRY